MNARRNQHAYPALERLMDRIAADTATAEEQRRWEDLLTVLRIPEPLHCLFQGRPSAGCVEHWPATLATDDGRSRLVATGPAGERLELSADLDGDRLSVTPTSPGVELLGLWRGKLPGSESWSPETVTFDLPLAWQERDETVRPRRAAAAAGQDETITRTFAHGGFCATPTFGVRRGLTVDTVFKSRKVRGPVMAELWFLDKAGERVTLVDRRTGEPVEFPRKLIRLKRLRRRPPAKHPLRRIVDRLGGAEFAAGDCTWTIPNSLPGVHKALLVLRPLTPEEAFWSGKRLRAIELDPADEGVYCVSRLRDKLGLGKNREARQGFLLTVRQRAERLEAIRPRLSTASREVTPASHDPSVCAAAGEEKAELALYAANDGPLLDKELPAGDGYFKAILNRCFTDDLRTRGGMPASHRSIDAKDEERTRTLRFPFREELSAENEPLIEGHDVARLDAEHAARLVAWMWRFVHETLDRDQQRQWWILYKIEGRSLREIAASCGKPYRTVQCSVLRAQAKIEGRDILARENRRAIRKRREPNVGPDDTQA